jgi:hypothetical protein
MKNNEIHAANSPFDGLKIVGRFRCGEVEPLQFSSTVARRSYGNGGRSYMVGIERDEDTIPLERLPADRFAKSPQPGAALVTSAEILGRAPVSKGAALFRTAPVTGAGRSMLWGSRGHRG